MKGLLWVFLKDLLACSFFGGKFSSCFRFSLGPKMKGSPVGLPKYIQLEKKKLNSSGRSTRSRTLGFVACH